MSDKEAKARIKINRLLEESGWRFFDDENGQANICLEPNVKLKSTDIDSMGDDFERTKNGFVAISSTISGVRYRNKSSVTAYSISSLPMTFLSHL